MTDPRPRLFSEASDEELLQQLADALRPPPLTPSPASLEALRQAVEQKWRPTGRGRVIGQLAAWARRLQRSGAALAILGGVVAGGTGVALAANRSMHPSVHDTLHNLGIPVLSWAADHPVDRRPATSSVEARPEAAQPTWARDEPATAPATVLVVLAPARLTGDRAPRVALTTWQRSWSAPAPRAPHPSMTVRWRATPDAPRACGWASGSPAGAVPAGRRASSPTTRSRPAPTNSWSGAGWTPPSTGGPRNGSSAPPTTRTVAGWMPSSAGGPANGSGTLAATRAGFGSPPYQASAGQTDATFTATRRDGPSGYGGRWSRP